MLLSERPVLGVILVLTLIAAGVVLDAIGYAGFTGWYHKRNVS